MTEAVKKPLKGWKDQMSAILEGANCDNGSWDDRLGNVLSRAPVLRT